MSNEVLHPGPTSAEVIRDIFHLHFNEPEERRVTVLDLTWGKGTFWKWNWPLSVYSLTANDLYTARPEDSAIGWREWDFTKVPCSMPNWDVVVFDPPHSAMGPDSQGQNQHSESYGSGRHQGRGLKGIQQVQELLKGGVKEACRLATIGIIIKTRDVVESGKLHRNAWLAEFALACHGWRVKDEVMPMLHGRPQPDEERGATVRHFRNRPSKYLVAVPIPKVTERRV